MTGVKPGASEMPWWREPTKGQWVSFFAAWLGWVMDAFDFTIYLILMPQITREFNVSTTAVSVSITLTLLVRLIGGYAAGSVADRWGRKLPLMISVIWFATCDGLIAFAPSFTWVLVLRTLFGFGMGAEWTSGATLAMENWPVRSRGIASGVLQGSWAIGYLLAAVVTSFVLPRFGWRAVFLVAAVPALLVLPIRAFVPESPDWLKQQKARKEGKTEVKGPSALSLLLAPQTLGRLSWACLVMALGFGSYYSLTSLYPTLLQTELGKAAGDTTLITIFNLGMMAGAIACGIAASRIGVAFAVMIPAILVIPALPLYTGMWGGALGIGAFLGGMLGAGYAGVTPLLLTSLFPPEIRARCVGIAYHVGAFAAAFVPPAVTLLTERYHLRMSETIAYLAGGCQLLLAVGMFLRPRGIDTRTSAATEVAH